MRSNEATRQVTWWEFGLRLALAVVLVAAFDMAARAEVPEPDREFDAAFRLPTDSSLDGLDAFVRHIRRTRSAHPDDLIVVFLGASPAYGVGIRHAERTFSAAFESAAASDTPQGGHRLRAFNLGANGLLLGDQYVIAKAIGDAADLFVVQLTYQTFDPRRSLSKMREPDLPSMLHVEIDPEEARALDTERRTDTPLDRAVDDAFRDRWFALAHKDEIASALALTDAPTRLYRLAAGTPRASSPAEGAQDTDAGVVGVQGDVTGAEDSVDPTTPFDELDPALQMVAISRASESSDFELDAKNGELRMLERLARLLEARDRHAVFFLAPMNEEVISAYEVLDERRYERNVRHLRATVMRHGFELVDYHPKPFLTSAHFVDLTHTTDEGGTLTGQRLWQDLRHMVEDIPAR